MGYAKIERHDGYSKIVWTDGGKLIISNNDADKIIKKYPDLTVDKR